MYGLNRCMNMYHLKCCTNGYTILTRCVFRDLQPMNMMYYTFALRWYKMKLEHCRYCCHSTGYHTYTLNYMYTNIRWGMRLGYMLCCMKYNMCCNPNQNMNHCTPRTNSCTKRYSPYICY